MTHFSYQRLDDGKSWGVKASGNLDSATRYAHQVVDVRKADGSTKQVALGAMITSWNGGRAAVYAIASAPAPRAKLAPVHVDDQNDAADDDHEAEYDDFAADAYRFATFYASPAGQLQKALDAQREVYRLADSFPVSDAQIVAAREAVEAARALVAAEVAANTD